eukprot:31645_1
MGTANSTLKAKALDIASHQIESWITGKLNDISLDVWTKLTAAISAYIKGETDKSTNDNIAQLLNKFINLLEQFNSSNLSSPSHSELIQDKDIFYHKIKNQYGEIESKIRSNYRNLLDQNIDNFFQYFELENISRQVHDLLNVETFFGENPIQMILISTKYHYRKVNDFYIRYIQLVLKGMILVLTYNNLRKNKNIAEIKRLCVLFNDLNNKFKNALYICKQRVHDHNVINTEVGTLIIEGIDKYNKYLNRSSNYSNKISNVLNRYICTQVYDYFNDKYSSYKWCCYAINKNINKYDPFKQPFSYWPFHKVYYIEYKRNNKKCIMVLMRVNKSDIDKNIVKQYKLSAMDYMVNTLNMNTNININDLYPQFMVNGICKGLMDELNRIDSMYHVTIMVTLDKFSYYFQTTNQYCFIRNIHREFLYNLEFKVILVEKGNMIKLQNEENGKYLGVSLECSPPKITMNNDSLNGNNNLWIVHKRYKNGNVVELESMKYPNKYLMINVDGNVELKQKFNPNGSINTDCILIFTRSYIRNEDCKWYGFVPKTHAFALKIGGYLVYGAVEKKVDDEKKVISKL